MLIRDERALRLGVERLLPQSLHLTNVNNLLSDWFVSKSASLESNKTTN
jgi:hypothetical protein